VLTAKDLDSRQTAGQNAGRGREDSRDGRLATRQAALTAALCLLTFFQGNVSMGYQLVGSRLLYPYFGSTIYVWALLISTFLLAFSIGSFLGGYVSRIKRGRRSLLVWLSLAGVAGFLVTAAFGRPLLASLDPSPETETLDLVLACGALFLVPVCAVSALSPVLADLASRLGRAAGPASGLVYGINTAGNITGIMLTVFGLIPNLPVSTILYVWLAAAVLLYAGFHLLDAALERVAPLGA
jgi:MFS family permease